MYWFLSQLLMLMLLAFFLGAALACLMKRLFAPSVEATSSFDVRPPLPAAADVGAAIARRVDPLPNLPPARPPIPAQPAAPHAGAHVNRFERALAGSQIEPPRPAPQPMAAPIARPPVPQAAPPPAPAMRTEIKPDVRVPEVRVEVPLVAPTIAPPPVSAGPAPVPTPRPIISAAATTVATTVAAAAASAYQAAKPVVPAPVATPVATIAYDDLQRIRAIDPPLEAALRKNGVTHYKQIAGWMKSDVGKAAAALGLSPGRIEHENWIEQAQILSAGGETAYSRQRLSGQTATQASSQASSQASVPPPVAPAGTSILKQAWRPGEPSPASMLPAAASAAGTAAAMASAAAAASTSVLRSAVTAPSAPRVEERAAFANRQTLDKPLDAPAQAATVQTTVPPTATPIRPMTANMGRDNLQRISGISQELERTLNAQGVTRYAHIGGWVREDIGRFDQLLGSNGRIARENWIEQAQILGRGGDTAYSRDFDRRFGSGTGAATLPPSAQAISTPAPRPDIASLPSVKSDAYRPRVDAATAAAAASAAATGGFRPSRAAEVDDLKRIRGIGVLIEKKLNSIGVVAYEQIAQWNNEDIDRVSQMLDFKGRIERENWVEQARILAAGGDTEFSRRVDRGDVETSKRV